MSNRQKSSSREKNDEGGVTNGSQTLTVSEMENGPPSVPLPPASSPVTSTNNASSHRSQQRSSTMMSTINSNASGDGYGNEGRPKQPPPTSTIFNSLYDDSDGSDGSIVFSNRRQQPPPKFHEPVRERERFPSFDSMASSGSVVRHTSPHGGSGTGGTGPFHHSTKITPQNLAKVNPHLLPYDQRRKLMKMKQQQQQQQQQQSKRDRSPPQAPPSDNRFVQYMTPPPEIQSNPYFLNGMPMPGPPSPQHLGYPMQPQHIPINMQMPMGLYPPQPNARLNPYRSSTPPRFDSNRPPPQSSRQVGRSRQYPSQQNPPYNTQLQSAPPSSQPLSHNVISRQPASVATRERLVPSSSIDSSDQDIPVRSQGLESYQMNQPDNSSHSSALPPPPPPPLSQLPPHHVRAESTGSVSSLGSQGSVFGYYGSHDEVVRKNQPKVGNDFLHMFNPFSQRNRQVSPKEAASEFHRQNQDFLKQSATGRPIRQPSPQQRHHRVGSMDRPPASRGTHKRLPSIENDDWEDSGRHHYGIDRADSSEHSSDGNVSPSSHISSSEETEDDGRFATGPTNDDANERTSLLPPPGQGSSEHLENSGRNYKHSDSYRASRRRKQQRSSHRSQRQLLESRHGEVAGFPVPDVGRESMRKHKKKKHRRRSRKNRSLAPDEGSQSSKGSGRHSSSSSSYDYRRWTRRRAQILEDERARLIAQWKLEERAETLASRKTKEEDIWHHRLGRYFDSEFGDFSGRVVKILSCLEALVCNLPLTIGAVAMAIALLGVTWFKFVEETISACEPVQFHSSQCTFPEFPGCFYCDTTAPMYRVAVNFHFGCSAIAGILALSLVLKLVFATQVILDEMSSPTTASPAGLVCMTIASIMAGRGFVGQILVSLASCVHLCLVVWFIYMALAYHIMPEPSWYPNSVGIGMTAVKAWLYYPMSGHFLMAISLSLNFFFFPISLIRVALNEKISATVAYMQMSAPAISLYALTIMAQPSFEQEKPDINRFQRAHRLVYLPAMHFLFVLSVVGLLASVQALLYRWKDFRKRQFSPAHAAFCFPTLSHANAIQSYRAAINSFSNVPKGSPWKIALDVYWVIVLVGGTLLTLVITAKIFYNLPSWTIIDVQGEDEPPAPYETTMTLQNVIATGESLVQPFVSPAVLQANETGALIMVARNREEGGRRFVRTRKLPSLGFEPMMSWSEMERERELLVEYVGKHPPRRRNRTLSVPGIDFSYGPDFGAGHNGVYGVDMGSHDMLINEARVRAQSAQANAYQQGGKTFF